jgi:transcription initiation factor TFIID subunit 2
MRMLEHRIGQSLLMQVFNKQLALAQNRADAASKLMSAQVFIRAINTVTGKNITTFLEQWVQTGGHARFKGTFVFNRKRNTVELEVRQENLTAKGSLKYVGPLTVSLQELDGTFKHVLQIEGTMAKMDITCHSKSRRHKKKKIPLCTGEEVDMDLSAMDAESPVLWIRLDPEMTIMRRVDMEQPDYMWQYQVRLFFFFCF